MAQKNGDIIEPDSGIDEDLPERPPKSAEVKPHSGGIGRLPEDLPEGVPREELLRMTGRAKEVSGSRAPEAEMLPERLLADRIKEHPTGRSVRQATLHMDQRDLQAVRALGNVREPEMLELLRSAASAEGHGCKGPRTDGGDASSSQKKEVTQLPQIGGTERCKARRLLGGAQERISDERRFNGWIAAPGEKMRKAGYFVRILGSGEPEGPPARKMDLHVLDSELVRRGRGDEAFGPFRCDVAGHAAVAAGLALISCRGINALHRHEIAGGGVLPREAAHSESSSR